MAKGYWIARMTVNNPDEYAKYIEGAGPAFKRHGAKFLVRSGRTEAVEGPGRPRNVVIEFASFDEALACYNAPDYQAAAKFRHASAEGEIIIVEGFEG
jgi:uncharacterized protein (DUF1330 family)